MIPGFFFNFRQPKKGEKKENKLKNFTNRRKWKHTKY